MRIIVLPATIGGNGLSQQLDQLTGPSSRARYEAQVPLGRLGQPEEIAHFCAALLDGKSNFQTGQFFSLSGGWNAQ
jgi:NAD(P)-dependent dehydrogenase (short-subunit alcohol dehydrogenase family)